ncbi:hypothetical protein TVAG_192520 [Trichomonas vaginalis G3]|uniref:Uncharacterized protein n=1 Tax=Trichomonas vaginalis (strain ATCC PRA-98 / G3) TaxID=412133 RepID=A2DGW6_TRIV3|nr:armadillo (ARM) repeat-containing protein family [Trichomonas vaginalis G3]EAY20276.1 hypothetical protein TVAG_192520 [Trichomonas vaginalis G3]KAI5529148.1 armadillo (ARM) repeat-containing protein family [Trichomonas vaginalis G3]|eukprot:XP_001581262.1 hypothetical protein [Trichomonas vaginalis G3]
MDLHDIKVFSDNSDEGQQAREKLYGLINTSAVEMFTAFLEIICDPINNDIKIMINAITLARSLIPKMVSFPFTQERDPLTKFEVPKTDPMLNKFFECLFNIISSENIDESIKVPAANTLSRYFIFYEAFRQENYYWNNIFQFLENQSLIEYALDIINDISEELTISNTIMHQIFGIIYEFFKNPPRMKVLEKTIKIMRLFVVNFDSLVGENVEEIIQKMFEFTQTNDVQEVCCDFWKEFIKNFPDLFPKQYVFELIKLLETSEHQVSILALICYMTFLTDDSITEFLNENSLVLVNIFISLLDFYSNMEYLDEDDDKQLFLIKVIIEGLVDINNELSEIIYQKIENSIGRNSFILMYILASDNLLDSRYSDALKNGIECDNVEIVKLSLSIVREQPDAVIDIEGTTIIRILELILGEDKMMYELAKNTLVKIIQSADNDFASKVIECLVENISNSNVNKSSQAIETIAFIMMMFNDKSLSEQISDLYPQILVEFQELDLDSEIFPSIYELSVQLITNLKESFQHLSLCDNFFRQLTNSANSYYGIYGIYFILVHTSMYSQEDIESFMQFVVNKEEIYQNSQDIISSLYLSELIITKVKNPEFEQKSIEICINLLNNDVYLDDLRLPIARLIITAIEQGNIPVELIQHLLEAIYSISGQIITFWNDDDTETEKLIRILADIITFIKNKYDINVSAIAQLIFDQSNQINGLEDETQSKIATFGREFSFI